MAALKSKLPVPHPDTKIPMPPNASNVLVPIAEEEVARAVRSFPNCSAGGLDGLCPHRLKDLISVSAERGGRDLLSALTNFTNIVLSGKTPQPVRSTFFGATLIALQKKGGGIRPIAVRLTLHHLAAKCLGSRVLQPMSTLLAPLQLGLLAPLQLGYGMPHGAEAAVHATRLYLDNMPDDHLFLKLDFSNAFNSLRRDRMMESVRQRTPEMYPFVFSAYEEPSSLLCGDAVLPSLERVQQGDPLGPLLFCLTIYPLIQQLTSKFRLFYLDDGIMGGCLSDILHDLQNLEVLASDLGIRLNQDKSELFCSDPATRGEILSTVPGLHVLIRDEVAVLRSPVGGIESLSGAILEEVEWLHLMGDRLHLMHAHDALLLLRHSFSMPKILHMLRTAPCFLSCS